MVKNMFCEKCKKNEATIHLSEVIKDMKSEVHLCEGCAREVGLNTKISNFSLSLPEMLTFLNVDEVADYKNEKICSLCGSDFFYYKRDGRLGCPECYNNLAEFIEPVLTGYHGDNRHIGKFPVHNGEADSTKKSHMMNNHFSDNITDYKAQLDIAVNEERYEEAAILRDKIRDINFTLKQK